MYIKDTLKASISGNAATATKLAASKNITVGNKTNSFDGSGAISFSLSDIGAAPSSHSHNVITNQDTRDVNTVPADVPVGLSVHLKNNGTDGLSDGGTYHPSLMIKPWNDKSGWPIGQLSVTQNNNLWFRSSNTDGTSWNSWKKVSLNGHTHSYLPLTGGTLTGRLYAYGKLSVQARGGSWIDTVNFDNVAIANNTEPSNGAYYPLIAARTEGGHTISLGSNYTGFGFYGFKNGRTENGVDLQFSVDVANHTMYTNAWSTFDNGMDVTGELNASLFRPKYAVGAQNCYIGGGNGDSASWESHNMVIRSHWGIGFRDYQNNCNIVFDTRNGNISTRGQVYSGNVFSCETGVYTNGYLSCQGDLSVGARSWLNSVTVSDKFVGETRFCGADGYYADPWEGTGCSIKAQGNIACNGSLKGGWLTCPQGEFFGWPSGSQAFLSIHTDHDGNGQGDGRTHLGYNNGDGYHHFFRGTGAMHINMHQGVQISNDFIYLAGIPLTISGNAPGRGGVWIQI
jgi:hypothetical protein